MNKVIGLIVAAILAVIAPINSPKQAIGPCPTEDSNNCYWDVRNRGNGEGTSFVTINGVTYLFSN